MGRFRWYAVNGPSVIQLPRCLNFCTKSAPRIMKPTTLSLFRPHYTIYIRVCIQIRPTGFACSPRCCLDALRNVLASVWIHVVLGCKKLASCGKAVRFFFISLTCSCLFVCLFVPEPKMLFQNSAMAALSRRAYWKPSPRCYRFLLVLLVGILSGKLLTTARAKPTLPFQLSQIPGFTHIVERRLMDAMKTYR